MKHKNRLIALIFIALVFVGGVFVWSINNAEAPLSRIDYRCGEGTEFALDYSDKKESVHLIPASNIEKVPDIRLESLPKGSQDRYEGGGVSLFLEGDTARITIGENPEVIICKAISNRND